MCRRIITTFGACNCVASDEPQLCGKACPLDDETEYRKLAGHCPRHRPQEDDWKDVPLDVVSDIYNEVMYHRRPRRASRRNALLANGGSDLHRRQPNRLMNGQRRSGTIVGRA
jgi:hypothetical protein